MLRLRSLRLNNTMVFSHIQKRSFINKFFMSGIRHDTQDIIKKLPPLEKAQMQKLIWAELEQSGKWWAKYLVPLVMRRQRSTEYINSLILYEKLVAQTNRPEWQGMALPQTFQMWVRLAFLHMWIIDVRFRYTLNARLRDRMTQPLYDWLWADIEIGIGDTLATSNSLVITKHSKRMVQEWFGAALAYDYGMITSDSSLAEALYRNIYDGNPDVSVSELNNLVQYVRQLQHTLSKLPDESLLNGEIQFIPPPFQWKEEATPQEANPALDPVVTQIRTDYEELAKHRIQKKK